MSTFRSVSNTIILFLAIVGCIVASVLIVEHFMPAQDFGCMAVGGNCHSTIESDYGHLGPIPTSVFGLGMYVTIIGICLKRRSLLAAARESMAYPVPTGTETDIDPADSPADVSPPQSIVKQLTILDGAAWVIAFSGLCISVWLQKVALYDLMSFCPWCLSSALLVTTIALFASRDLFIGERGLEGEQKLVTGVFSGIAILAILMGLPDILKQIQLIRDHQPDPIVRVTKPPPPAFPVETKDMELKGNPKAPFLVVEFADYQCPHCAKTNQYLIEQMKENPNRFRLAFRNYPLNNHKWASQAAVVAEAAGLQGKFWEMHDYLFAHQSMMDANDFDIDKFTSMAVDLGLDRKKFEDDCKLDKLMEKVATDATAAPQLGCKMTPTFFIISSPTHTVKVTGLDELKTVMKDSDNIAWKTK